MGFHFSGPAPMFAGGWLGVHMFFVLSGFLITTLLLREEAATGRISLLGFWVRRIFRIAPAYYAALLGSVLLLKWNGVYEAAGGPEAITWFLTFNPELAPSFMNFTQAWTIGIEQKFYLVWPLLGFVLLPLVGVALGSAARARAVACALILPAMLWLIWHHNISWVHYVAILLGCGVALMMHARPTFRVLSLLSSRVVQVALIVALYWVQSHSAELTARWAGPEQLILIFSVLCALGLPSLCGRTEVSRVLAITPFRWLGERSYSIYLFQVIGGHFVAMALPAWPNNLHKTLVVLVVVVMIADFVYRFVERPGIQAGRWLASWLAAHPLRRRPAAQVPVEAVPAVGDVLPVGAAPQRPRQDSNLQPTD
ncbi:acyltransferase family protein [Microbacterium sp. ARD31]|uniref:acyltransferase family protein n=1 Tax=Microbacterium sp. ARD31 TaxID=2962576 RepID=UPI0037C89ED6